MTGRTLGRASLRLDAIYCLVLGAAVAIAAPGISTAIAVPGPLVLATGLAVVMWSALVEWMRATLELALALRIVMAANIAATLAVALVSLTAAAVVGVLAVLAVAVDVALFASSQAIALGRLRAATPGTHAPAA